jgi:hypothetical protein
MAGPWCGILLPEPLTGAEEATFESLITAVGNRRGGGAAFWVATTKPIGGSYEGDPRPFDGGLHLNEAVDPDPKVVGLIAGTFGFPCADVMIEVGARYNDPVDHRLLAEVAAWLAEKLGGVISVGGPLPLPVDHPGRHVAVPISVPVGSESTFHVLDATALRAWCKSPHFHMIT